MERTFVTEFYGIWHSWIENSGLRALSVDMYDNTTGVPEEVLSVSVKFAEYGAYPVGTVELPTVVLAGDRTYEIVLLPKGPKGAQAFYHHEFDTLIPPVAAFTYDVSEYVVSVDASASDDIDGDIVEHEWEWGDGSSTVEGPLSSHTYSASGFYSITLTVTDDDSLSGSVTHRVYVTGPETGRSVTWTISNMFELREKKFELMGRWGDTMGINPWLPLREANYGELIVRDSYPFMIATSPYSTQTNPDSSVGFLTYSWYRMYTEARNIAELGTGSGKDPVFLPILGDKQLDGGNVEIRWYSTYLGTQELTDIRAGTHYANTYYGVHVPTPHPYADDGFWHELQGRIWFDRAGAAKFLGLPGVGDLRTEFAAEDETLEQQWLNDWMTEGSTTYDIYAAYDFSLDIRVLELTADPESTADVLVLRYWSMGWGSEILLVRYLNATGVWPNWQAWPDDFYLNITMGPEDGDLSSRAVMAYHLSAWKDLDFFTGAWRLESDHIDWCGSTFVHPYPTPYDEYDPDRTDLTRQSWSPGTRNYGNRVSYWSAPTELDLEAGERLIIKLPSQETQVLGITPYRGASDTLSALKKTELLSNMYWGELVMGNGWPNGNESGPGLKDFYDPVTKTIDLAGPLDFPRNPNPSYQELMEMGAPTFLFDVSEVSYYDVVVGPEIVPGVELEVTVTARDASGAVVTDWNSTMLYVVTWVTEDGGSVLSIEHTFDLSDAGVFRSTVVLQVGKWLFEATDQRYGPDVYGSLEFEFAEAG